MSRKARIVALGALHHIIVRGIERRRISSSDQDWNNFINRLVDIVIEAKTICFSWALIPNQAHLLLRTGQTPLTIILSRLLTNYAGSYNHRHRRHGRLIHSGWKSATRLNPKLQPIQSSDSGMIYAGNKS